MGFAIYDAIAGGTPDYAGQAANQEAQRQAAIKKGTAAIDAAYAGFTPDFYNKRAQAYENYALPQLAKQYNDTKAQVGFGLANRGQRGSSVSAKAWSDLFRTEGEAKQGIADTALGQSQALQENVAQSKNNLLNMLYQSADPAGAAAQATSTASSLSVPSTFAPLANQFSGLINQYYLGQVLNPRTTTATSSGGAPAGYGSSFAPLPQPSATY